MKPLSGAFLLKPFLMKPWNTKGMLSGPFLMKPRSLGNFAQATRDAMIDFTKRFAEGHKSAMMKLWSALRVGGGKWGEHHARKFRCCPCAFSRNRFFAPKRVISSLKRGEARFRFAGGPCRLRGFYFSPKSFTSMKEFWSFRDVVS